MLEVMISTVLRKSTVRPCASVSRPSSKTCSSVLKTSGFAFSTSSNSTTEYGLRRTASVSGLAALRGGDHGVGGAEIDTNCNSHHELVKRHDYLVDLEDAAIIWR